MTRKGFYFRALYYISAWGAALFSLGFSALLFLVNDNRLSRFWPFLFLLIGAALLYSIYKINRRTRKRVKDTLSQFKCDEFKPQKDYEIVRIDTGKYVGIDTTNGTILLASVYDNFFKGMRLSNFSGYSCRGDEITFKFNDIRFPSFTLNMWNESKCMEFAHRLDVLLSSTFRPESPTTADFGQHVMKVAQAS